ILDLSLANHLLKALQPGCHLLLVGDVDQLPSVGAGDVLRDIIASDIAPVTPRSAIFRPASGSQIITNAHPLPPRHGGPVGVNALNGRRQTNLNPPALMKPEKTLYGQTFRTGDRVMQTQNDYNKDVN